MEVLVFVDEPQLVLLSQGRSLYLGLATNDFEDGSFFCVSTRKSELIKYFGGKADLHYMYAFGRGAQYFVAKPNVKGEFTLNHYKDQPTASMLPDVGFFAENHTSSYKIEAQSRGREKLLLDGNWQLQDFGRFQQLYAEVYSFFAALDLLEAPLIPERLRERLTSLISGLPYQGGGSYLSVFRGLDKELPKEVSIGLVGIRKNSPGDMVLAGVDSHFKQARSAVAEFIGASNAAREAYSELHNFLKKAGLLKESVKNYDSNINLFNGEIERMTRVLLEVHGVDHYEALLSICGGNTLAVAKVALGFHRRVANSAVFFAEGRVRFADEDL